MDINNTIKQASQQILSQHRAFAQDKAAAGHPNPAAITWIIEKLRVALFPGYFSEICEPETLDVWLRALLADIRRTLSAEIAAALPADGDAAARADDIAGKFIGQLSDIQRLLYLDAQAGFDGDPAARGVDEIILTYPGFFSVFVHRIAHCLYAAGVPLIPRVMSEYAHGRTGIDINPGAVIGEYFFIDHGTGVVIGETTVIGDHVKLYQGVTLGALSTRSGQRLAGTKRHPTIENRVTIYSGATILGGETVIGENSTIGGNVFIIKSVPKNTTVRGI